MDYDCGYFEKDFKPHRNKGFILYSIIEWRLFVKSYRKTEKSRLRRDYCVTIDVLLFCKNQRFYTLIYVSMWLNTDFIISKG
jgi:hypothetical protein